MKFIFNILIEIFYTYKFKFHNNKKFNIKSNSKDNYIIVEVNRIYGSHIAYSYIIDALKKKYNSKLIAFKANYFNNFVEKLIHLLFMRLGFLQYIFYNTFGKSIKIYYKQQNSLSKYDKYYRKLKNKKDVLKFKIDNVLIGDLIYDSYLRYNLKTTINLLDDNFRNFFLKSVDYYFYCKSIFKKYEIKSVVLSHTIYLPATMGRIALQKNISFYCVHSGGCVRLGKDGLYNENFKYYKKEAKKLSKHQKKLGTNVAKKELNRRLNGDANPSIYGGRDNSTWAGEINYNYIKTNHKIKVLVALHDFYDSPHVFGNFLFADFQEWLNYLGKLSLKTDYEWYLKLHPSKKFKAITAEIIKIFLKKYKKFKVLNDDISHLSYVKKIDYVLTIHGNIAQEYALFNKTVITGSPNGRFTLYNYNINPKNFKSYNKILLNLKKNKNKLKINKSEIYFSHYTNRIFFHPNFFFNFDIFAKSVGWENINNIFAIKYWLKNFSNNEHRRITDKLSEFVEKSEKYQKYRKLR